MSELPPPECKRPQRLTPVRRVLIEVGFIVFLYYSNLLMGEFERSGSAQSRGLIWAVRDVLTLSNFTIAIASALVGFLVFEFFRKRL
jgi:hypothetical protein